MFGPFGGLECFLDSEFQLVSGNHPDEESFHHTNTHISYYCYIITHYCCQYP